MPRALKMAGLGFATTFDWAHVGLVFALLIRMHGFFGITLARI